DIERTKSRKHAANTIYRNRFLFLWKNLHDRRLFWRVHVLPTLGRFFYAVLVLDFRFYGGLVRALRRLPDARRARQRARAESLRTDGEIMREVEAALSSYADSDR